MKKEKINFQFTVLATRDYSRIVPIEHEDSDFECIVRSKDHIKDASRICQYLNRNTGKRHEN